MESNRINRSPFRIHLKNSITSLFAFRRLTGIFPDRSERDFEIELPLPFCEMYWNWLFMSAIHCYLVSNKRIEFLLAYTIQKEFFQGLFFRLIDGGLLISDWYTISCQGNSALWISTLVFVSFIEFELINVFVAGCIKTTAILDIETRDHYWLTVFAQDHGIVPLFSSVEVSVL